MPKYIWKPSEYIDWISEEYVDHDHEEYTGSTEKTGRKYKQTIVRGFTMPGSAGAEDRFGFGSNLWMGANSFAPGGVYEAHQHETFQYFYVIEGTAKVIVGGEERTAEVGTWVFVPPFTDHYVENTGDGPFTYILVGGNPPPEHAES